MVKHFILVLIMLICCSYENAEAEEVMTNFYNLVLKDIDGKEFTMETYQGHPVLIVNVASKCGFTPQYQDLEELYRRYKDKGLVILGFPANDFLWQEPGTDTEIKKFCHDKYNVTFPMFSKIVVKGANQHPLYQYLTSKETNPEFSGSISWNFNKFLIDKNGKIVNRFGSRTKPLSDEIIKSIEAIL